MSLRRAGRSPFTVRLRAASLIALAIGLFTLGFPAASQALPAGTPFWSNWNTLSGSTIKGNPVVVSSEADRTEAFVRSQDDKLWFVRRKEDRWHDWRFLGAPAAGMASDPTAVSSQAGRLETWVRGTDNRIWFRSFRDSQWDNGWADLGAPPGGAVGTPSAVSHMAGQLHVFVRGADNKLWSKVYSSGAWGGAWNDLGQPATTTLAGNPSVVSSAPGRFAAIVRGADNKAWFRGFDGAQWGAWENLGTPGGALAGDPVITSSEPGRLQAFVRGADDQLWFAAYGEGRWYPWISLGAIPGGGTSTKAPAAMSSEPGRLEVTIPSADGHVRFIAYGEGRWYSWYDVGLGTGTGLTSPKQGRVQFYVTGVRDLLFTRGATNGVFGNWENLGPNIVGKPALVSSEPGRLQAFARGWDNHVWYSAYGERRWWDWTDLGEPGGGISATPAVISSQPGRLQLFARGLDNKLWFKAYGENQWYSWADLGAPPGTGLASTPSVLAAGGGGRLQVFARGLDNKLWFKAYGENQWYSWADLGIPPGSGGLAGNPAVVSSEPGRFQVFVRGADNKLWFKAYGENQWYGWQDLGGTVTSDPAVLSSEPGRLQVFARGADNKLWFKAYGENRWYDWADLGLPGTGAAGTPTALSSEPGRLQVFTRGADNKLWFKAYGENQWHGWSDHAGTLGSDPAVATWDKGTFHAAATTPSGSLDHVGIDRTKPTITSMSGGLYDARNQPALTNSELTIYAEDDYSGVTDISVTDEQRNEIFGRHRTCPTEGCSYTGNSVYGTFDPVALGWQTGTHTVYVDVTDAAGNVTQTGWDVQYYPTSWQYGGANRSVDTDEERVALEDAMAAQTTDEAVAALLDGLSPTDRAGMDAFLEGESWYDPSDFDLRASSYEFLNSKWWTFVSSDGIAEWDGTVKFFKGKGWRRSHIRRGEISSGRVRALSSVGCLWAKVTWGYIGGSFSFPSPSVSVSGLSESNGWYYRCRTGDQTRPTALDLKGLNYAKAFLTSVTISIGTSATKADGPRNTANGKVWSGR